VVLTPTHLAIAMEYAAGGELFERICSAGRFSEDEVSLPFEKLCCAFANMKLLVFRIICMVFGKIRRKGTRENM